MSDLGPVLFLLLPSLLLLLLALTVRMVISRISHLLRRINATERTQDRVLRAIREDLAELRSEITSLQAQSRETFHTGFETFSESVLARIDEAISQAARVFLAPLADKLSALSLYSKSELEALADSQRNHTSRLAELAGTLQHLSTELRELGNQRHAAIDNAVLSELTELGEQHGALLQRLDAVDARLDHLSALVSQRPPPVEIAEIAGPKEPAEIPPPAVILTPIANINRLHIEPIDHPGGPRGPMAKPEGHHERHSEVSELVCRKRQGHWIVAVHVPEPFLQHPQFHVFQDTLQLARDEHDESLWLLSGITGTISIHGSGVREIALGSSKTLTFKLNRDCTEGRRVRSLTSGLYLVLVPHNWSCDEQASPQPLAIEPVVLPGLKAFLFDLEEHSADALRWLTEDGQPAGTLSLRSVRFTLLGHRLNDSTPGIGPLFGGSPPKVETTQENGWRDVDLIIIGAEGSGAAWWRTEYVPNPDDSAQDLSHALAGKTGGWYFLRFYDRQHQLIDSIDFRFLNGLTDIRCPTGLLSPGPDGHESVEIEFLHDDTCVVRSANESPSSDLHHIRTRAGTLVTLAPDPASDLTSWHVQPSVGSDILVTLRLRRIWWAQGNEDASSLTWTAKRLTCRLYDFEPTSGTALWLHGPTPKEHRTLFVELHPGTTQRRVHFSGDRARVPLREFCDAPELQEPGTVQLQLHVEQPDTVPSICLTELLIRVGCRRCGSLSDTYELLPEHIAASHLDELLPPLTYEETYALLREHMPSLPSKIYKCQYCRFYAPAGDLDNPTSIICDHIQYECPEAPRPHGAAHVEFRVISDVQEVRANVIPEVPEIRRCTLCGEHFTSPSLCDMMEHLGQHHSRDLGELS